MDIQFNDVLHRLAQLIEHNRSITAVSEPNEVGHSWYTCALLDNGKAVKDIAFKAQNIAAARRQCAEARYWLTQFRYSLRDERALMISRMLNADEGSLRGSDAPPKPRA